MGNYWLVWHLGIGGLTSHKHRDFIFFSESAAITFSEFWAPKLRKFGFEKHS
jgi:hypothetical protein